MKNAFKVFGIIALVAVIGFSMVGCDFGNDTNSDDPNSGGNSSNGNSSGKTPGSTKENAILVTVGHSSSYTISSDGTHWFKFIGTGETVIFETTGNVVDTVIHDDKYILTQRDDNSGEGYNALHSFKTTLGETSFLFIKAKSGTSGTYTFHVKAVSPPNIQTNPISVIVGYSSSFNISGGQYWYRLEGTGNSVVFETSGNVVNTNLQLYVGNSTSAILTDNTRISFSTLSGTAYYIKITSSNAGTYIFSVRNGTGDGSSKTYAIPVTVGYSSSHNISTDGKHWFSFLGTGNTVTFKSIGNVVDTVLHDDKYILTQRDDNSGEGYNFLYSFKTTLGETSFLFVTAKSGTSGTYTFVVE